MAQAVNSLCIMPEGSFAVLATPLDWTDSKTLAANTAEAFAVPANAKYALFGADVNFCARYNAATSGTAAAYGDVADGTGCQLNPTIRFLKGVAEISVITDAAAGGHVSVTYFR